MDYAISDEQTLVDRIRRYVEIETPSRCPEQMDRLEAVLRADLEEAGAKVTGYQAPSGTILTASVGEGPRQILLLGHRDTVFNVGTLAENPFREEVTEQGRMLRGPGVNDMKAGVAFIVEILRHFHTHPKASASQGEKKGMGWRVTALLNCDEEVGSRESRDLITRMAAESELTLVLEPGTRGRFCTARKGITSYVLTAKGISAHSGVSYLKGASAIQALAEVITRVYQLRDDEKNLSVNIGSIQAEGKNNIVCPLAEARGELRSFSPAYLTEAVEQMQAICDSNPVPGTTVSLTVLGSRPPMVETEVSRRIAERAMQAAASHGISLEPEARGGGSDGAFASKAGCPVLDGMGAEGSGAHTENEFAVRDTLMAKLKTCIDVIRDFEG